MSPFLASEDKILITGNEAIAEAAIQAGCTFYAGYPITPQNELCAYMSVRMSEAGGVFIQAESELAAINMVFGAAVAGARAMTSSSSPGISLKQEGISYIAGCELPAVIVNMVRGGPGLGNIAPSQSDYLQATRGGGHGDYRQIVLAPWSVSEAVILTKKAFGLADTYRMPVLILGDGMLGQMMEPVSREVMFEKTPPPVEKPWVLSGCRGREPRVIKSLYLGDGALEAVNRRLQEKYRRIEKEETLCEFYHTEDADIVIVAYGTASRIARGAVDDAREKGLRVGLLRPVTLWPFPSAELQDIARGVRAFLVCEMSEGQLIEDVRLGLEGARPVYFYGRSGGGIVSEKEIAMKLQGIYGEWTP